MSNELKEIANKLLKELKELEVDMIFDDMAATLEDYILSLSKLLRSRFQEASKVLKRSTDDKVRQTWNETIEELQRNLESLKLEEKNKERSK